MKKTLTIALFSLATISHSQCPDSVFPTASAPVSVNVECTADVPLSDPLVVTDEADNNGPPTVAHFQDVSDGNTCPEVITRTYSVTDICGNVIMVDQIITVNDITAPTASNPANIYLPWPGPAPAPDVLIVTDEADACSTAPVVAFVSDVSNGLTCPEIITRTYSVTDECGNTILVSHEIHIDGVDTSVTVNTGQMMSNMVGAAYQWVDCDNNFALLPGETNQSFTPSVAGNYAVIVNNGGCIDTSACFENGPLSVGQSDLSLLRIFPSPSSNTVNIEFNTSVKREYFILSLTGAIVSHVVDSGNNVGIDVSELAPGMYVLKVSTANSSIVEQILIE